MGERGQRLIVDDYSFGRVTIGGRTFTDDVVIFPDRVDTPWRRARGHELSLDDLGAVLDASPATIIVGTGSSGRMKVPQPLLDELEGRGFRVIVTTTTEAVRSYNTAGEQAVAALHLTC